MNEKNNHAGWGAGLRKWWKNRHRRRPLAAQSPEAPKPPLPSLRWLRLLLLWMMGASYLGLFVLCVAVCMAWLVGGEEGWAARLMGLSRHFLEHLPSTEMCLLGALPAFVVLFFEPIEGFLQRLQRIGLTGAAAADPRGEHSGSAPGSATDEEDKNSTVETESE